VLPYPAGVTSQPGWHPDPVPPQPGQPLLLLRYWDGAAWTEHTAPAQPPAAAQQYAAAPAYPYAVAKSTTTPDGVPLAGWWHRVAAYLLDALILGVLAGIIAAPWIGDIWSTYKDWFDDALRSGENGSSSSIDTAQLQRDLARPLAFVVGIQLAVGFCYHVGFLMWRQATPGKLLLGLRVRLRDRPGRMPLGTVTLRWVAQFAVGILGLIPYVGSLTGLYSLLDALWPLWDEKKQAIHDKVAKTNVVRIR
jgi:uncharacterized RDD family membrane protein YckC